ncbi:hypothetical protein V9T40_005538 [Parthenolecanium corni]|uniref:Uncharacterized protein n=1 Tax=Parthenolecanium corni TaxID=536013 RepID=A0AAN9YAW7_9HEMI
MASYTTPPGLSSDSIVLKLPNVMTLGGQAVEDGRRLRRGKTLRREKSHCTSTRFASRSSKEDKRFHGQAWKHLLVTYGAAGRCVVVGCHSWVPAAPFGAVCARTCDLLLVSRLMYAVGTLCEGVCGKLANVSGSTPSITDRQNFLCREDEGDDVEWQWTRVNNKDFNEEWERERYSFTVCSATGRGRIVGKIISKLLANAFKGGSEMLTQIK